MCMYITKSTQEKVLKILEYYSILPTILSFYITIYVLGDFSECKISINNNNNVEYRNNIFITLKKS